MSGFAGTRGVSVFLILSISLVNSRRANRASRHRAELRAIRASSRASSQASRRTEPPSEPLPRNREQYKEAVAQGEYRTEPLKALLVRPYFEKLSTTQNRETIGLEFT